MQPDIHMQPNFNYNIGPTIKFELAYNIPKHGKSYNDANVINCD